MEIYDKKREHCNLAGVIRMIGFRVGLFYCRVAAYLNLKG